MNSEDRKKKFIILLKELLERDCNGVQARLAKKLNVGTSRISRWLSGQTDPLNLDALVFSRIAGLKNCSTEELAKNLSFGEPDQSQPNTFTLLLQEMLSNKTQEELGKILGVSQIAISNWLNPEKNIEPANLSAGTMFALAHQKGWTIDDLLIYLNVQEGKTEKKLLINYQSELSALSLTEQVELLSWLSDRVQEQVTQEPTLQPAQERKSKLTICILLEQEDASIASLYTGNLLFHLQLKPENISIATPDSMPDSLENLDVLIFDINSPQSPCIPLVESLEFQGDILIFADTSLPDDEREHLSQQATDLIVKPVPWDELKNKPYFS